MPAILDKVIRRHVPEVANVPGLIQIKLGSTMARIGLIRVRPDLAAMSGPGSRSY
jgi:hypothetical protein